MTSDVDGQGFTSSGISAIQGKKKCKPDGSRPNTWTRLLPLLRVLSLLLVHVLIGLHILHFLTSGRTISPVEPSEAMATLELGKVNAGFVFFSIAIIATMIFGRFFCGWGCHIVALQDGCAWLLKRWGFRPRPVRARLLKYIPLCLATYLFVWPQIVRITSGTSFPAWSNSFVTNRFWATFPGFWVAMLSFVVCGGVAIVILGNKGFCTYVCPYGAIFGFADRISAYGIVKTENCVGCGQCTAACTSNVLVHLELKAYGEVKDTGCMKCLDCVSTCPTDGLRFQLRRGSKAIQPAETETKSDWTIGEEILGIGVWAITTIILRGLYDSVPLLLAACFGVLTAIGAMSLASTFGKNPGRFIGRPLKLAGKTTGIAWGLIGLMVVWSGFLAHSELVQWHRYCGRSILDKSTYNWDDFVAGKPTPYDSNHSQVILRAERHFLISKKLGLLDVAEVEAGLAWCAMVRGNYQSAQQYLDRAAELDSNLLQVRQTFAELRSSRTQMQPAENTE